MEPVSRQLALDLSGIQYDQLDDEVKAKVDAVFSEEGVETTKAEGTSKYRLSDKGREGLNAGIDMKSVHKAIADKMLGDLGLDL